MSLSTFSATGLTKEKIPAKHLKYSDFCKLTDSSLTLKGFYSEPEDDGDGFFAISDEPHGEIKNVFECEYEEEFYKQIDTLSKDYQIFHLKKNGTLSRIKFDQKLEPPSNQPLIPQ